MDLPEDEDGEYRVDFRERPEKYEVERGEQGVFKVQPYKGELLPLWGYADRETADEAGEAIYGKFRAYLANDEFVGADMARKYLRMGYTRAMRYARYPGGRKYVEPEDESGDAERVERDPVHWADGDKREAALVFDVWLEKARTDGRYRALREAWGGDGE
jgi:hypothetical protein